MYAAAGVRRAAGDAAAALERLNFERRFGGQPSPDVDGALVAMAHQLGLLAASILRPLAVAGDADAQYWLATTVLELHRSPSDDDEVIRWYRAAALGGVPVDVAAARRWYEKAAAERFERADEALATVGSAQP